MKAVCHALKLIVSEAVTVQIESNSANTLRYTNIDIWSADESTLLGKFHLSQYYQVFE